MLFAIKKIVGAFIAPLAFALLLVVVAQACRMLRRYRAANYLFLAAFAFAYLASIDPVGSVLLHQLEQQHPALRIDLTTAQVQSIAVLGATFEPREGLPVTAGLDEDGLVRIVEGVRLAHQFPQARLILCGGALPGATPSSHGYRALARELGIAEERLTIIDHPLDTGAEALALRDLLGSSPFVLVTSAYHTPRAMRLMERAGARPMAAPTGHLSDDWRFGWRSVLPSSGGLAKTERALHEYAGLVALSVGIN
jgi:uncharacterized SAM-binding protein YcdF (DUF218 family)